MRMTHFLFERMVELFAGPQVTGNWDSSEDWYRIPVIVPFTPSPNLTLVTATAFVDWVNWGGPPTFGNPLKLQSQEQPWGYDPATGAYKVWFDTIPQDFDRTFITDSADPFPTTIYGFIMFAGVWYEQPFGSELLPTPITFTGEEQVFEFPNCGFTFDPNLQV